VSTITVELNGERARLEEGASVRDAVDRAGGGAAHEPRGVAVAVDGEVVPRSEWDRTSLHGGQSIEVMRAVQGG
jgi:sulfur carrier protein